MMEPPPSVPNVSAEPADQKLASELSNLLQIISGTSALLENIWEGRPESARYFKMLHESVERAEKLATALVQQAGGSRDNISLPPAAEAGSGEAKPDEPIAPEKKKHRIMVVDDEPMALELYEQILTDAGFEVSTARSGFQCLDLLRRAPRNYKLILLDLAMPLMDGEETFERLRRVHSEQAVVLMTGFVEQARLQRLKERGLAGFLQKPKRAAEIISYVQGIIQTRLFARVARQETAVPSFT